MSAVLSLRASGPRHFLDLKDFSGAELRALLDSAINLKHTRRTGKKPLTGKTLAMIFEKPSTRTRVSFEVAVKELGGDAVVLSAREMQLGRGETIEDTANVLSRFVHGIMLRTDAATKLHDLARCASIPVINGLTELSHPCQLMADIMTFEEHKGPIAGQKLAWVGDGNNVAASFIEAAARFNFSLRLACPAGYMPRAEVLDWAKAEGADVQVGADPAWAVENAACVVTDTWLSMSDSEDQAAARASTFAPYQVTAGLMEKAAKGAIFQHCLPAHRGEEVAAEVIDGPASVVFDEAENRLHAQKAILAWAME
ncbi:MAG: ornithine carbamoyltransferase [Proteobacteria bacterium]|nr:ornithine carbamoyltransferase [Pseudomonadota bacterium]MBU6425850.1 ornithine carbamoyltransferase [Rhodospirillales bacterium]